MLLTDEVLGHAIHIYKLVLSTCPLRTNSGCGKEMRIFIGPWSPVEAASIWRYLEVYWTCAGEFLIIIVPSILIQ